MSANTGVVFLACLIVCSVRGLAIKENFSENDYKIITTPCACGKLGCTCCIHIEIPGITSETTSVCTELNYSMTETALTWTVTFGDITLKNKTITEIDFPEACVTATLPFPIDIPKLLPDLFNLCVKVHNVDLTPEFDVTACIKISMLLWGITVSMPDQCFLIPNPFKNP